MVIISVLLIYSTINVITDYYYLYNTDLIILDSL